jgi:galactokinase
MEAGDLESLGTLLYQTHHGLQHLYEVSCPELDFLVDQTRGKDAVLGARMMGGGFGGCTLNLIKRESIENFKLTIKTSYEKRFHQSPNFYLVKIENGAC